MGTTVQDVMSHQVITVSPDTGYRDAIRLIEENHVHALPVVEEGGRLLGMLSESDLMCKEEAGAPPARTLMPHPRQRRIQRLRAQATTVRECMSQPPITIRRDCTLGDAARIMRRRHVGRLPVVDEHGKLVGIVTRSDLLSVYLRSDEQLTADAREVLDAVCGRIADSVTCTVSDGHATLTGTVPRRSEAGAAAYALLQIPGLISIDNQLKWHTDDVEVALVGP